MPTPLDSIYFYSISINVSSYKPQVAYKRQQHQEQSEVYTILESLHDTKTAQTNHPIIPKRQLYVTRARCAVVL